MRQIITTKVADRQFAEDIVHDAGCHLDGVVTFNTSLRVKASECERFNEFLQRYAVLQTH